MQADLLLSYCLCLCLDTDRPGIFAAIAQRHQEPDPASPGLLNFPCRQGNKMTPLSVYKNERSLTFSKKLRTLVLSQYSAARLLRPSGNLIETIFEN
jgi:hypothetical protein